MPEVHRAKKGVDPNLRPEWIVKRSQKLAERSRIEQDEENSPIKVNQVRNQLGKGQRKDTRKPQTEQSANKSIEQNRENVPKHVHNSQEIKVPIYPNQITKPPPKPPDRVIQDDRQIHLELDLEMNRDFEENSPYQEGIISEIYHRPDKSQLVDPP